MKNNAILIGVVAVIIGLAGGFFIGKSYQSSQTSGNFGQFGNGQQRQRTGLPNDQTRMTGRQIIGEIISQDDKSITIKLPDGSTKIILFSEKTSVIEATSASTTALAVGKTVGVFGTTNTDGSITAQNIQLNPVLRNQNGGTPRP